MGTVSYLHIFQPHYLAESKTNVNSVILALANRILFCRIFRLPRSEAVSRSRFFSSESSSQRCPFQGIKLDQTCSKWIKHIQIGTHLSKMDQTCSNLSKPEKTCPKWIKLVQNGSNLSGMDQTCPKIPSMSKNL